ncbi:MAG TPA: cell division ATP-binding protein FtsE [Patescibacteria group bacterium]|nr:cell division ATP-binding protein FtsE [Patescibacteria group bacterium]
MIRFEHVGLRYGIGPEVLSDINFSLEPGSFHFLTGPSGAGKTSLMSLMYLGRRPTRGLVTMFDQNINGASRETLGTLRQRIGVVFQDFRLLPHLSVFDNVALPMRIQSKPEKQINSDVHDLLEWVGLGSNMQQLPNTLSGGQQQRIAIARAVITRPRLLLADEPTGNLDDEIGFRLMSLFEQLNRMGTTIVIATHNVQMMSKFNHIKLVLDKGQLRMEEPVKAASRKKTGEGAA